MENRHFPGMISEKGRATPRRQLSLGPCGIGQSNSRCHACAVKALDLAVDLGFANVCKLLATMEPGQQGFAHG